VKLVVGLGNPGPAYDGTRHNLGYLAVRCLARDLGVPRFRRGRNGLIARTGDINLLLPTTYMNASGTAVADVWRSGPGHAEGLIVIHDDLDLPVGRLRIRVGGSSGGHRGVASIIEELGFEGFVRVKIGIGRPPQGLDPVDYVLARPEGREAELLADAAARAAEAVLVILREGVGAAMNSYNRVDDGSRADKVPAAGPVVLEPGARRGGAVLP